MRLQSGTLADRLTCWSYSAAGRAGLVHEASPVLTLTLRGDAEGRYTYQYQVHQRVVSVSRGLMKVARVAVVSVRAQPHCTPRVQTDEVAGSWAYQ